MAPAPAVSKEDPFVSPYRLRGRLCLPRLSPRRRLPGGNAGRHLACPEPRRPRSSPDAVFFPSDLRAMRTFTNPFSQIRTFQDFPEDLGTWTQLSAHRRELLPSSLALPALVPRQVAPNVGPFPHVRVPLCCPNASQTSSGAQHRLAPMPSPGLHPSAGRPGYILLPVLRCPPATRNLLQQRHRVHQG